MEIKQNQTSFGMAFVSPKGKNMQAFKKYLAKKTGTIDVESLGHFVIEQAKNLKMNITFKNINNKDYFEIFEKAKPTVSVLIDANDKFVPKWKTEIQKQIKDFITEHPNMSFVEKIKLKSLKIKECFLEKNNRTKWENLPDGMKKAGDIATQMENSVK